MTRTTRRAIAGYCWIAPWVIGFLAFKLGPMLAALVLSLTSYDVVTRPEWIGLENYVYAFTVDPLFWRSLRTTFYYVGASLGSVLPGFAWQAWGWPGVTVVCTAALILGLLADGLLCG